jgi:hypothetical protein
MQHCCARCSARPRQSCNPRVAGPLLRPPSGPSDCGLSGTNQRRRDPAFLDSVPQSYTTLVMLPKWCWRPILPRGRYDQTEAFYRSGRQASEARYHAPRLPPPRPAGLLRGSGTRNRSGDRAGKADRPDAGKVDVNRPSFLASAPRKPPKDKLTPPIVVEPDRPRRGVRLVCTFCFLARRRAMPKNSRRATKSTSVSSRFCSATPTWEASGLDRSARPSKQGAGMPFVQPHASLHLTPPYTRPW